MKLLTCRFFGVLAFFSFLRNDWDKLRLVVFILVLPIIPFPFFISMIFVSLFLFPIFVTLLFLFSPYKCCLLLFVDVEVLHVVS
jgi:hypothetical protein